MPVSQKNFNSHGASVRRFKLTEPAATAPTRPQLRADLGRGTRNTFLFDAKITIGPKLSSSALSPLCILCDFKLLA